MDNLITTHLFSLQDESYRDFVAPIVPTVAKEKIIGIRTPVLRKYAKELCRAETGIDDFLSEVPHDYFEENQLHAFIISEQKDFSRCIAEVEAFLPFVDNWATSDQMIPKVFKKHRHSLLPYIEKWLSSGKTYTVRYAIGVLMQHFLGDDFEVQYLEKVAAVRSDEYYVNMMIAWYFATALAKQFPYAIPFLEQRCLSLWTHNKTIQKAIESRRISDEQKQYLRTLKRKE